MSFQRSLDHSMTSLPSEVPPRFPYVANAYNMCLRLEKSLQEAANEGQNVGKDLIYIRILGFLFHHVPTDEGLKTIINEVCSTAGNSALLLQVGKMYFDHFIRPCTFQVALTPLNFNFTSDMASQLKPIRIEHQRPPVNLLDSRSIQWQI